MAQSLSPMAKAIRNLAYRHGTYNVFADFCEMAACSFSNAVDKRNFDAREERYMTIVRKYTQEEVNVFPQLLGMLSEALEVGPRDVMGELFHELELHNEHAGQFFTPYHLCEMMAQLTYGEDVNQIIEQNGFITCQEPACGSGAMVIGLAKTMYDRKINFQQCLHVSAIDLDSRCVHMAYLQFSLLHIPAVVYAGNTLTMEIRDAWYTPAHILGGWNWRLRAADRPASEVGQMETIIENVMELTEEPASLQ
ncbi:N-6 DNA methylase [Spirosoma sp. HMF4905]|uniref:N-6 DNA methylase n=1 Tax=Spirosoma arboris TaxID=2682092 RepID=A0A7K1SKF2_9BACT|nr:N-6 DNA methylase [Spirosoma arboris]MVM34255.1 N-6 DNA methylase [Spirosoma arboris]